MDKFLRFLFPVKPDETGFSAYLLIMRIVFGLLLMSHGFQKLTSFSELVSSFPDPLGVGASVSLSLAIFGELFCSIGFIFGAFYRLAMIPMIVTMWVAFFSIHGNDPFATKELAFSYLMIFILMYVAGPGKYSLDHLVAVRLYQKKNGKKEGVSHS